MFVLLTLSKEHPLLAAGENQPLDMQSMAKLVHNAVTANFPETIDPSGKMDFNWVVNRKQHNHVQFLVQLPSVAVDALLVITAMGPFPEAERQEFLEDLLNGKDISTLVVNPAVSVAYKYHYEIMGNVGDKIEGDIGASLLRDGSDQSSDVFCMFYPIQDSVIFDQFSRQENLDNWTLTKGGKIAQPKAIAPVAISEAAAKGLVKCKEMLPLPEDMGSSRYVFSFTGAIIDKETGEYHSNPTEAYRFTDSGLEAFGDDKNFAEGEDGEQLKTIVAVFLSIVKPVDFSNGYALWQFGNYPELLGPGSYLVFGVCPDGYNIQVVKHTGMEEPDKQYVELGTIAKFNPEFEEDVNNDSGN